MGSAANAVVLRAVTGSFQAREPWGSRCNATCTSPGGFEARPTGLLPGVRGPTRQRPHPATWRPLAPSLDIPQLVTQAPFFGHLHGVSVRRSQRGSRVRGPGQSAGSGTFTAAAPREPPAPEPVRNPS